MAGLFDGVSMHNYRWQYARNAEQLRTMEQKARRTGRKVNGYTADELAARAADFERFSRYTDDEMAEHFMRIQARVAGRPLPHV